MNQDAHAILNWRYNSCDLETDPSLFGPFQDIVKMWSDRRQGEALPSRRDFDFFDFKEWWGRISIAKIELDPLNVRFVLWGTQLTAWWGVDYTNKEVGEASISPDVWKLVEWRYFERMTKSPFIGVAYGPLDQHGRKTMKVMGIDLPLAQNGAVTHVVSAHIKIRLEDTPDTILPDLPSSPIDPAEVGTD